ncbi:MAG: phosphatidic acid phosphatase [Flammeovirgaceae bacterium]|nr:phosphatidic acid phosphatase [Flammeovirgaceae bacterium]
MKNLRIKTIYFCLILNITTACLENNAYQEKLKDPALYNAALKQLTDVIVHDIFSPPVASRVYAYPNIAAYEIMAQEYPEKFNSLSGQLNDFKLIPKNEDSRVNMHLAALHAFLKVGTELIFSENKMQVFQDQTYQALKADGLSIQVLKSSMSYGDRVATHILKWADGDYYKQTRTDAKYTIRSQPEYWKPTPPAYMQGIEPHWNKIRTMVLDSAQQYIPKPPLTFSMDENSLFYKELMEVYRFGGQTENQGEDIAKFWDCNPYVSHHRGHVMFATKKITPGGHWMGISAIATRQAGSTYAETIHAHTRVAITLFDAFISCWDEKWRSVVVRPETLINEYIDEGWVPLLQTPPFPEYTSGHSVISRAAALTLTELLGENFSFEDTSEMEYGLPSRSFDSFLEASEEAALSRLYGGIHYRMAIDNGLDQGDFVGNYINSALTTRK